LADKAIKDDLTRILVIMGACAGLCYNALWYFPILILIGGVATVLWDVWLQQQVGRLRSNWEAKRRQAARNEGGDAEGANASQSISLDERVQSGTPGLTQRKSQIVEGSDGRVSTEQSTRQSPLDCSPAAAESTEALPVADTQTHNISVKMGILLIVGFLSM
jgi:hypothetical protein